MRAEHDKIKYLKKSRKEEGRYRKLFLEGHCLWRVGVYSIVTLMMDSGFWVGSIKSRSFSTENVPGRCESGVYLCLQPRPPLRRRLSWWTLCCRPPATVKAMNCNGLLIRARTMVTDSGRFSNLDFSASNSSTSCLEIVWCPRLHRPRIRSLGPGCHRGRLRMRRLAWDFI